MPPNSDKPQDEHADARKKPGFGVKTPEREARLSEALRANLRRRKKGGQKQETDDE
jgi:hypothetical protein